MSIDVATKLQNKAGVTFELLGNGSVHAIRHGEVLINQVLGSPLEGGIGNVYLRRLTGEGISSSPLLGPASTSQFRASEAGAAWEGSIDGLEYSCALRLAPTEPTWFWTVRLANVGLRRMNFDVLFAQDLGLANEAAVRSSELYTSQYIDHTVLDDGDLGYLVCSRQNLPQAEKHPWIMHGCLEGAAGYLTDGFQFYGLEYRVTGAPAALGRRVLPNRNYQYELALPTLQSRKVSIAAGATEQVTFFAAFEADHPSATNATDTARARAARRSFRSLVNEAAGGPAIAHAAGLFDRPTLFQSVDLDTKTLERFFGSDWRHEERRDGTLMSFFHGSRQHVVLKAKELVQERPTGHIMRSGSDLLPSDNILSVTAWMFGVFASQLTIGNTSFNKLLGVNRSPLNVLKASGQRIFVRTDRGYELLGVPSAFEMGPNSARWIYQNPRHVLAISVTTSLDAPVCRLSVEVERGGPLELLISHQVVLGENEHGPLGHITADTATGRVELQPGDEALMHSVYPDATFFIVSPDAEHIRAIGGDELLYADGDARGASYVVMKTKPVTNFSLIMTGSVVDAQRAEQLAMQHGTAKAGGDVKAEADSFWSGLAHGATLGGGTGPRAGDLARLNQLLRWYLHNAMVHYTTPHGLEQYSGAAWGLRDVCQGPTELLVATRNLEPLRQVLRIVYEHQSRQTADWPQWFMFDRYRNIRASDSHADIIHWPIKALCDYVEASGDLSILDEQVAYTDEGTAAITSETEPILAHTERQIDRIERDCIPETALPIFGGGDWEDTLQPADPQMARRLVSAWTVELAYQTLSRYRVVCERAGKRELAARLETLCTRMRSDFNRHLMPDGIVAGLAHFGRDGIEYFLHPRDDKTGVVYRLLPMTRGILSDLFTLEQAKRHVALVDQHLTFPDGVRLMNRPMEYRGGTSRYFKRAESAANFGREIGLQYVHAHIRYVEAMCRYGRPEEAFRGLLVICPILLELDVPSALTRQSNAFFSSSDADFMDRRQASRQFGRIKTGRVGVKGGWRVYSSGPGLYINQLISNVVGLRTYFDDVVFDPVLPADADGLTFDFEFDGRPVRHVYHVAGDGYAPREVRVNGRQMPSDRHTDNPYRRGGMLIAKQAFEAALDRHRNVVEVFI